MIALQELKFGLPKDHVLFFLYPVNRYICGRKMFNLSYGKRAPTGLLDNDLFVVES